MSDCKDCPERPTVHLKDEVYPNDRGQGEVYQAPEEETLVSTMEGLPERKGVLYNQTWVIYTGGPPEAHLFGINRIIPKAAKHIKVNSDGSIEYEKGPDDFEPPGPIDGFQRAKRDDHLFLPQWGSCVWRHFGVSFKTSCQCINVLSRCGKTSRMTSYAECEKCEDKIGIPEIVVPKTKTVESLKYPEGLPVHSPRLGRRGTA